MHARGAAFKWADVTTGLAHIFESQEAFFVRARAILSAEYNALVDMTPDAEVLYAVDLPTSKEKQDIILINNFHAQIAKTRKRFDLGGGAEDQA